MELKFMKLFKMPGYDNTEWVSECQTCGAVVTNTHLHASWHNDLKQDVFFANPFNNRIA